MKLFVATLAAALAAIPATTDPARIIAHGELYAPTIFLGEQPMGGACVVTPFAALTARHVVADEKGEIAKRVKLVIPTEDELPPLVIEAIVVDSYPGRDIVELRLSPDTEFQFDVWHPLTKHHPEIGATVHTLLNLPTQILGRTGFGYIPVAGVYGGRVKDEDGVFEVVTSQIAPGSSGTCILDEEGRTFALATQIRTWGVPGRLMLSVSLGEPLTK